MNIEAYIQSMEHKQPTSPLNQVYNEEDGVKTENTKNNTPYFRWHNHRKESR
ncbi:hypothetical protein CWI38_0175p0020 [Hamiltosporidium tvaerminnensis]|uniref:Uncharacterized protein n=1 Tax=Hamiltosporidium tvaerminnensis TaxID=1176355 RepID=A0A4Q9M010_9MICR|nr:hypothetical protein CWI38_0175p0020 [Hamiltosporidium tvaerminnensis]